MKETELKLLCELMKNSWRSDREIARALGVSQPTVTRLRDRLGKQGYIKEYTVMPDFRKLGFEIMAITFSRRLKELTKEELMEARKASEELERENHVAVVLAADGAGLGFSRAFITFHENYSSYMKMISLVKQVPHIDTSHVESFVVSLFRQENRQLMSFSVLAKCLLNERV